MPSGLLRKLSMTSRNSPFEGGRGMSLSLVGGVEPAQSVVEGTKQSRLPLERNFSFLFVFQKLHLYLHIIYNK
jgi:hypothetical protein